ncbi:MAG TPA: IPT/TIG domain-containing protein, partial [Nevskia sp.]|nr:IPT/TIG domain-containing protein [Nevskia sp.]
MTAGFVLLGASLQVQAALPKPYISGFTPTSGPVGTVVTVSGVRFSEVNKAWVGTRPATFSVINSTTIRLTVPTGAVTATIKVANPQFSSGSTAKFTVTATPPPP